MAPPFRLRLASWGWRTLQRNAQLRPSQMRSPAATGTRKRGKRGQPTFDAHRRMALVAGATPPRAAAPDARQRTSERSILINPPQRERARGPARGDGATLWRSHVGRVTRIWRNGEVGSFSRGRWDALEVLSRIPGCLSGTASVRRRRGAVTDGVPVCAQIQCRTATTRGCPRWERKRSPAAHAVSSDGMTIRAGNARPARDEAQGRPPAPAPRNHPTPIGSNAASSRCRRAAESLQERKEEKMKP